jgi:hypothetical protein
VITNAGLQRAPCTYAALTCMSYIVIKWPTAATLVAQSKDIDICCYINMHHLTPSHATPSVPQLEHLGAAAQGVSAQVGLGLCWWLQELAARRLHAAVAALSPAHRLIINC